MTDYKSLSIKELMKISEDVNRSLQDKEEKDKTFNKNLITSHKGFEELKGLLKHDGLEKTILVKCIMFFPSTVEIIGDTELSNKICLKDVRGSIMDSLCEDEISYDLTANSEVKEIVKEHASETLKAIKLIQKISKDTGVPEDYIFSIAAGLYY